MFLRVFIESVYYLQFVSGDLFYFVEGMSILCV